MQDATEPDVGDLFRVLADWWHEATDALSSPAQKVNHQAYQQIIAMGRAAVLYILADVRDRGGYWFYALEEIERTSPLPKDNPVPFDDVKNAWLQWGQDHEHHL